MKEIAYIPKRLTSYIDVSSDFFHDCELRSEDNFILDTLRSKLPAYIYSLTKEEKTIKAYVGRPSFFDWLLRRDIEIEATFKIENILKDMNDISKGSMDIYKFDFKKVNYKNR